jgi:hypothetical protein
MHQEEGWRRHHELVWPQVTRGSGLKRSSKEEGKKKAISLGLKKKLAQASSVG